MLEQASFKRAAFVFLFGLLSFPALANDAFESEEGPEHGKINTADASPVDPGHYEVEVLFGYSSATHSWNKKGNIGSRGLTSELAGQLSATAGFVEDFDAAIATGYAWLRDKENDFDGDGLSGPKNGRGLSDFDFSGRYRFLKDAKHNLDVAYIAGFTVPTGTESSAEEIGTSQGYWSFNQSLVASKDWDKWTANADVGYALPFGEGKASARGTLNADIAGGYQALSWLQPEIELNYSHDFLSVEPDADVLAITAGLVMPITEAVRINTGLQQAVWGRNADKTTTASFAIKLAF